MELPLYPDGFTQIDKNTKIFTDIRVAQIHTLNDLETTILNTCLIFTHTKNDSYYF